MGEKLASLSLRDENKSKSDKEQEFSVSAKSPSADSVHVLLKQALNADDRTLLLDCLYTQDEKVIRKSIEQLSPSNFLKLLYYLVSMIESRGAILACALPWLKFLLLQHASGIMSKESSFEALNSFYRKPLSAVYKWLSKVVFISYSFLEYVINEKEDEGEMVPTIYEDKDSEDESEDGMETDHDSTTGFNTILRKILNIVPEHSHPPSIFFHFLDTPDSYSSSLSLHTLPTLCLPILHTFLSILVFHPLAITRCPLSSYSTSLSLTFPFPAIVRLLLSPPTSTSSTALYLALPFLLPYRLSSSFHYLLHATVR
ncbi:hypothetical protein VNO78_25437 [Psophocarpus tetragonolobus]|uniref:Small-subunit processome Utp12 domain-containing protein n=1 Tax=Psophocarpus tetragonolobus TaxID=3891 RepID=A0AAN9SA43_PSOTE